MDRAVDIVSMYIAIFICNNINLNRRKITSNKNIWIDTMMVEECGILPEEKSPIHAAAVTFFSFNLLGFVPLVAYHDKSVNITITTPL